MMVAECLHVTRRFGQGRAMVSAVVGATCRVPRGARIAVTGTSGSGKSTLLHLLAGIDAATEGPVSWPGLPARRLGRPDGIGVVFQGPSLLPGFDVADNVAMPMMLAGRDHDDAYRRAAVALDLVGMGDTASKLPEELSGGQAQRVAIARVVAARPALILADEPTGQLDHANAERVVAVLLDVAAETGAALVVSTHDPAVAGRMDDVWQMRDGRLVMPEGRCAP